MEATILRRDLEDRAENNNSNITINKETGEKEDPMWTDRRLGTIP